VRGKTGDRRAEAGGFPMRNHSRPDLHRLPPLRFCALSLSFSYVILSFDLETVSFLSVNLFDRRVLCYLSDNLTSPICCGYRTGAPRYQMLPIQTDLNTLPVLSDLPEKLIPSPAKSSEGLIFFLFYLLVFSKVHDALQICAMIV
jgi:hypothetical protein